MALRAAFAVVRPSGRQVAAVVLTTLLARQHYRTFAERFKGTADPRRPSLAAGVAQDMVAVRKELAEGTPDVVVGTHALLAKGISSKDLGLIIDEEQHFGVKHKERLKELKADVHVLTLSATPIPRTLQRWRSPVRELSIIATPPVDRTGGAHLRLAPSTRWWCATPDEGTLSRRSGAYVCPRLSDLAERRSS